MPVDGMRNRGRPNLGWRDLMKEDMSIKQMTTEMAKCRKHWHFFIQGGTLRCLGLYMRKGEGKSWMSTEA